MIRTLTVAMGITVLLASAALAQNANHPSSDWNGNWGFSSPSQQQIRLLQAEMIAKREEDYYARAGQQVYHVHNESTLHHYEGPYFGEGEYGDIHVGDEIGQNTNVIGAINNSNTTIDGDGNTVIHEANNAGCLDGSIVIDGSGGTSATANCN